MSDSSAGCCPAAEQDGVAAVWADGAVCDDADFGRCVSLISASDERKVSGADLIVCDGQADETLLFPVFQSADNIIFGHTKCVSCRRQGDDTVGAAAPP